MTVSMFTNSTVTHNVYCLAVQVILMATYAALFFLTASQNSVHGECTEAPVPSVQMGNSECILANFYALCMLLCEHKIALIVKQTA